MLSYHELRNADVTFNISDLVLCLAWSRRYMAQHWVTVVPAILMLNLHQVNVALR